MIPNSGVHILSNLDIFTGYDNLSSYINSRFRDLFFRAHDWYGEFEDFIDGISVELDALLETYTECYRRLPVEFSARAAEDLNKINACYSD